MAASEVVADLLEAARAQGFIGSGTATDHIAHSLAFVDGVGRAPERVLDLGSGGGLPGLVLAALAWPTTAWVLLEVGERRSRFLVEAVEHLDLGARVVVDRRRAEVAAHDPARRATFDAVVARSFPGGPGVVAECAVAFLAPDGVLVVSEPPPSAVADRASGEDRWPAEGLARVGLVTDETLVRPARMVRLRRVGPLPPGCPRRTGVPAKRPLF